MVLDFIIEHWADILIVIPLFALATLPAIPPTFAGLNKTYFDSYTGKEKNHRKLNFFELIIQLISYLIVTGPVLSIGFRGTITLILFVILGADLFLNKRITDNAVTLSIVGIIALYLEKIIESADEISIWKIFTWKAKGLPYMAPIQQSINEETKGTEQEAQIPVKTGT